LVIKSSCQNSIHTYPGFNYRGYVFGLLAFSGGLTDLFFQVYQNNWEFKVFYGVTNVLLMGLAVLLQRNAFLVFGGKNTTLNLIF